MSDSKKKVLITVIVISVIISGALIYVINNTGEDLSTISIYEVLGMTSTRKGSENVVLAGDSDPFNALVCTPLSCWYDISAGSSRPDGLRPFLIAKDGKLDDTQERFITNYNKNGFIIIGSVNKDGLKFQGGISEQSLSAAQHEFESAAGVMIVHGSQEGYELGVSTAPLASYLNIPILIIENNTDMSMIKKGVKKLGAKYCIAVSAEPRQIAKNIGLDSILVGDQDTAMELNLIAVKDRFGSLNYLTMTNPSDVVQPYIVDVQTETFQNSVNNVRLKTGRISADIVGESTETFDIEVPSGLDLVQIYVNFTSVSSTMLNPLKESLDIEPLVFGSLYDESGNIASYGPSFSLDLGKTFLQTLAVDAPGNYKLEVSVYYGTAGFDTYAGTELGLSRIDADYQVTIVHNQLSKPHHPIFESSSMMAPYLSASHGGITIASSNFSLTDERFALEAKGHSTGPWYDAELNDLANAKVDHNVQVLDKTMAKLMDHGMYNDYINGSAWLAILGGANMIPMYYEPKEASWVEDPVYGVGWATDLRYSFDSQLSTGRPLGQDVGDISTLIARTLFYEEYATAHSNSIQGEYGSSEKWLDHFHFLAGEGGGRTGWFFWQRTFAPEVEQHGFTSEVYVQNYENDRQSMESWGAYERANYFDLMLHGNWYWYVPELNGFDRYSTGVKVSDIMTNPTEWELGPSVLNSGVCIMGRIDGINPRQSITMAFLHAGINAFYSSTRSTGSEAKAGTIETSLLYDDISVGEALRLDKLTNTEPAGYYVRNLYADPAFNPYEPENGFSDQGRPVLIRNNE